MVTGEPRERLVVLGASNVQRSLGSVIATAHECLGGPLDLYVAAGHGRSYGMRSRVVFRTLPGIIPSGLWPALERSASTPLKAVITDVGNDLLYHADVETIAGWVETCVSRLRAWRAEVVITGLPLERARRLKTPTFMLFRTLFVPACRLTRETVLERAERLQEALADVARRHGATFVLPDAAWYGVDPIHVTRRAVRRAWRSYLAPLASNGSPATSSPLAWSDAWTLRLLIPAERTVCGVLQRGEQPARVWRSGSRLWLY